VATISEALALAVKHHQAGDVDYAEEVYRRVLQADPENVDAWCYLGTACLNSNRLLEAVEYFRRALRLRPDCTAARSDLGIALAQLGRTEEAAGCFREAIRLRPDHAEAYNNLGIVLAQLGKKDEAKAAYEEALRIKPDHETARANLAGLLRKPESDDSARLPESQGPGAAPDSVGTLNDRGLALAGQGRFDAAIATYRQALEINPASVIVLNNLGLALQETGKLEEAEAVLRQALVAQPDRAEVHNNLGAVLKGLAKTDEAEAAYRRSAELKPQYAEAHNNLGSVFQDRGELDEAVRLYRHALWLKPDYAEAHLNLATALVDLGSPDEGVRSYEAALRYRPDYREARWGRALAWLHLGDFERGWREYEWRWGRKGFPYRPFRKPVWDGTPFEGKTMLLHTEQGFGDALQFVRFVPLVKECGGTVWLECRASLLPLLASVPGVDRLIEYETELPEFDVHAPLMSLPGILGTRLNTVPAAVPYLRADPARVAQWRRRLGPRSGLRVGIAWQGNPGKPGDQFRSIPLAQFAPLARLPGVRLFGLQKGPGREQVETLADRFPLTDLGDELDTFADTAAILANLDLVVCMDSALAHCAGALGTPAWLLLNANSEWRWLLGREDSPWYPSLRLFRQTNLGPWEEVFERVTQGMKQPLERLK